MFLSREEEAIYRGEAGETLRRCMEILVALGDIFGAERLVDVKSVQIAGVSYKNIGEAGLSWISDMRGSAVVPAILNPAGMDLCRWREMGITEHFASKQLEVIEAYRRLGVAIEATCTPYQIFDFLAGRGDHLAWSESSAVAYANSVIGARTNREGGPSALAAALTGKTPLYGYHLDESRVPSIRVRVKCNLSGSDYGALGFLAGKAAGSGVPYFKLQGAPSRDDLKALGAAMAASGAVALFYVEGTTQQPPDALEIRGIEEMAVERSDIVAVYEENPGKNADVVAVGCPHCSVEELSHLADLLEGKKVQREMWVCTARKIAVDNPALVSRIEASGAKVFCDTCMVVSPASERYGMMMVNSGKALSYIPGLCGISAGFGSIEECVAVATSPRKLGA